MVPQYSVLVSSGSPRVCAAEVLKRISFQNGVQWKRGCLINVLCRRWDEGPLHFHKRLRAYNRLPVILSLQLVCGCEQGPETSPAKCVNIM
jgi:hypothetical protein